MYYKRKRIHGQEYMYISETRLVEGKPRPVTLGYLGKPEAALRLIRSAHSEGRVVRSYAHGAVAVLLSLADRLGLAALIDEHARPPRRGVPARRAVSVGATLVAGILDLAVHATSKRGFAEWAQTTTLPVLGGFEAGQLTSQYFWDQMDRVSEAAVESIGAELSRRVQAYAGLRLDTLFYDSTNFFTFIDSANTRCDLPQRGHSKQKRHDLRQVNVGLLVARDGWIALRHELYRGNVNDVSWFPHAWGAVPARLRALGVGTDAATLVCDGGHGSKDNWGEVDASGLHYVAALSPERVPDLAQAPLTAFAPVEVPEKGVILARREARLYAGRERRLVAFDSPTLRQAQLRGLQQELLRPLGLMRRLQHRLEIRAARVAAPVEAQIGRILRSPRCRRLVCHELRARPGGRLELHWWLDADAYAHLRDRVFGRRLLVTDRAAWTTAEILQAYWGLSEAERAFRDFKDPDHGALHTPFHWTDQKLRVHAFMVVTAYMLGALVRREARRLEYTADMAGLIELLDRIRVARIKWPSKGPGRPRGYWQREEASPEALRLYHHFALPQYDLGSISSDALSHGATNR
jgi:transposase